MKNTMKAASLRSVLSVVMIIIILAIAAGFYFAYQKIRAYAVEVNHSAIDAEASEKQITELQKLKQELSAREGLVTKANQLFATSDGYQAQALSDVQKYAQTYGVTISNTSFDPQPEGSNENIFVITLASPLDYSKLLRFIEAIEGNLPKMQITSVDFGRVEGGSSTQVTSEAIKIKISTR